MPETPVRNKNRVRFARLMPGFRHARQAVITAKLAKVTKPSHTLHRFCDKILFLAFLARTLRDLQQPAPIILCQKTLSAVGKSSGLLLDGIIRRHQVIPCRVLKNPSSGG